MKAGMIFTETGPNLILYYSVFCVTNYNMNNNIKIERKYCGFFNEIFHNDSIGIMGCLTLL